METNPWFKDALSLEQFGKKFRFAVPHDVFSTLQVDDGTRALLDHLPEHEPKAILDMGCGYGALGLPIAALYPSTEVHMVDRDLLAVEWSRRNADEIGAQNAAVYGSLGFRDVTRGDFDWILCNVPARIGEVFIEDLFLTGQRFLSGHGEISVVVIRDLGPTIESIALRRKLPIREIFNSDKHIVYSLKKMPATVMAEISVGALYRRDRVSVAGLDFDRPFDISGDAIRLEKALPVLIDALPKRGPEDVFCMKASYGILPILASKRWPTTKVVATDRDLLATTFARENARKHSIGEDRLQVIEAVDLADFHKKFPRSFDLIIGEISPAVGSHVVEAEIQLMQKMLKPTGQALVLSGERMAREWLIPMSKKHQLSLTPLIVRTSNMVLRLG